jgi:hypothetical protein
MATSDRELKCIHGLTTRTCSLCQPASKTGASKWVQATKESTRSRRPRAYKAHLQDGLPHGPRVIATFDSTCECGNELVEGEDMVYLRDGTWCCEECALDFCESGSCHNGSPGSRHSERETI